MESLSGLRLPRGQGTVTRCPLVLQMRSVLPAEQPPAGDRGAEAGGLRRLTISYRPRGAQAAIERDIDDVRAAFLVLSRDLSCPFLCQRANRFFCQSTCQKKD